MSIATRTDKGSTALHPADTHDLIRVQGARVNNLKDVNVEIPKRRLTVFTGVSGSGKSSLVFGTIAAESQRLINETYSAFLQSFMGSPGRPDVDALHNLSAAIVVDQERMGANARSTLGTATDAYTLLRILFSRLAEPGAGSALAYSFNAEGMCPACEGLRKVSSIEIDPALDRPATFASCPASGGARLKPAVLASRIDGRNIAECAAMQVSDPAQFLAGITARSVGPVVSNLRHTLESLVEIGLG